MSQCSASFIIETNDGKNSQWPSRHPEMQIKSQFICVVAQNFRPHNWNGKSCPECTKYSFQNCEPMIASSLPNYPWWINLFRHKVTAYLLVFDYFSRYPKIAKLTDTTSNRVIAALQPMFAIHRIPEVLQSNNGLKYVSQEMTNFATSYGFTQVTSSPHYPRSNGLAKRTVKTVKAILEKSKEPHLAPLSYFSTEFSCCGLRPAQLLMGRRIRSTLPQVLHNLIQKWSYLKKFEEQDRQYKKKQKIN